MPALVCPCCGGIRSRIVDSRKDGQTVRRRRVCEDAECQTRWSTYELSTREFRRAIRILRKSQTE